MINKLRDLNEALPNMILIDLLYLIIGEVIVYLWLPQPVFYGTGLLAGVIYSIGCSIQMSFRIRNVVYGRTATKTLVVGYIIRLSVMLILFAVLYYFQIGDLLAALIGMFSMKVSAYLQPLTNKFLTKICRKGR